MTVSLKRLLVRFLRYSRGMKKGLWLDVSLGASYGLDVYAAASASVGVLSSTECSPVESRFEFLAVLLLPLVHCDAVFLLDPVAVPFGYDVERAEGYDPHVRCEVVYVAALQSLFVLVVLVLEVHHSEEHASDVELPY